MASVNDKLVHQFEFYFSASNLPKDNFLKAEVKDNDGWARLSVLAGFKRVQQLSTDLAAIAEALKASTELEVSEDGLKVRRKTPLPEDINLDNQTVRVTGLNSEWDLDQVQDALIAAGLKPKCVRLHFHKDKGSKKFAGSAFVELGTPAEAEEAAKKGDLSLEGCSEPVKVELKQAFVSAKEDAKKAKEAAAAEAAAAEAAAEAKEAEFESDLLVAISALPAEGVSRETLREWCEKVGAKVQFIDYERGLTEGKVRLSKATEVKAAAAAEKLTALGDAIKVGDATPKFAAITGDEEKGVWSTLDEKRVALKAAIAARGPVKRRGFGGNHGNKRARN